MRLMRRDISSVLSEVKSIKEAKAATANNYLKAFTNLTEINNNAYAVISGEEETADRLLLSNIRWQVKGNGRLLVFCVEDTKAVSAVKYSPHTTGDITIIKVEMSGHIVEEIEQIIGYISDISSYDTVYILGFEHDELSDIIMSEFDRIAEDINIPVFVGFRCFDEVCTIPIRVFTIEPMAEYSDEWEMMSFYSLSYSETNHRCLLAYDLFTNRFADFENPFSADNEESIISE